MFDREFLSMLAFLIKVKPFIDKDRNNDPVYGDESQYRGRITGKTISLRHPLIQDGTPIFDVYIGMRIDKDDPTVFWPITGNDIFTVNDFVDLGADPAWVDGTPMLFAISRNTDEDGHHHVKLQCGWMYHRQGQ